MLEPFGQIRHEIMKGFIRSCRPDDKVIVDLGAGNPAISEGIPCRKRIKIDINTSTQPDIVHDLAQGIPLPDASADICVASEIIEHLYASKLFLKEIKRILTKDGVLVLSTPNICSLKYRIAFLLGYIPAHAAKADCFYPDESPGHIRDYNFAEMEKVLSLFNFEILDKRSDGLSFMGTTIIPPWLLPKTFGDSIILRAKVVK